MKAKDYSNAEQGKLLTEEFTNLKIQPSKPDSRSGGISHRDEEALSFVHQRVKGLTRP